MTKKRRPRATARGTERRRNPELREVLDELVEYVRELARSAPTMGPSEIEYAQERLEWLAEEVWRAVIESQASRSDASGR